MTTLLTKFTLCFDTSMLHNQVVNVRVKFLTDSEAGLAATRG